MTLQGVIIDNGIGSDSAFRDRDPVKFKSIQVGSEAEKCLDLSDYDLLIAPNGTDHVALYQHRHQIRQMLNDGKSVLCFCGWFTDWLPGNHWFHDNQHATRDMRHFIGSDPLGLLHNVDLTQLDKNEHGIYGWWACGHIQTEHPQSILIRDIWDQAVVIADQTTTSGFMFLTASGPLGDFGNRRSPSDSLTNLYENVLNHVVQRHSKKSESIVDQKRKILSNKQQAAES